MGASKASHCLWVQPRLFAGVYEASCLDLSIFSNCLTSISLLQALISFPPVDQGLGYTGALLTMRPLPRHSLLPYRTNPSTHPSDFSLNITSLERLKSPNEMTGLLYSLAPDLFFFLCCYIPNGATLSLCLFAIYLPYSVRKETLIFVLHFLYCLI